MATLDDVARYAGVSTRTVLRVLHNKPHVSQAAHNRVQEAIRHLRYTPNLMARSMATGQTGVLALSLTSITSLLVGPLIKGAMDHARQRGYQVVLCETDQKRTEEPEYLLLARSGLVDGVVLASHIVAPGTPPGLEELKAVSLVNYDLPGVPFPQFIQDCEGDVYLLTRHLLDQGIRHIAMLSGPADRPSTQHKRAGYLRAHAAVGLTVSSDQIIYTDYTVEGGKVAMATLLTQKQPQAIFAGSDLIAIGALTLARQKGLSIPDNLLLCGFDDHPFSLYVDPPLTTVKPDMHGLGTLAVEAVINQLTCKNANPTKGLNSPHRVFLPGQVVIRASTRYTHQLSYTVMV